MRAEKSTNGKERMIIIIREMEEVNSKSRDRTKGETVKS
jgi:hypothetical protein